MLVSDNLVDFTPSHLSIRINHDVIVVNPHVFPVWNSYLIVILFFWLTRRQNITTGRYFVNWYEGLDTLELIDHRLRNVVGIFFFTLGQSKRGNKTMFLHVQRNA